MIFLPCMDLDKNQRFVKIIIFGLHASGIEWGNVFWKGLLHAFIKEGNIILDYNIGVEDLSVPTIQEGCKVVCLVRTTKEALFLRRDVCNGVSII